MSVGYDINNPERPVPGISDRDEVLRLSDVVLLRNCRIAELEAKLQAIEEHVLSAAPTGWAAACDLNGAAEWEKKALSILGYSEVRSVDSEEKCTRAGHAGQPLRVVKVRKVNSSAKRERAAIVAWMREQCTAHLCDAPERLARDIENGAHESMPRQGTEGEPK